MKYIHFHCSHTVQFWVPKMVWSGFSAPPARRRNTTSTEFMKAICRNAAARLKTRAQLQANTMKCGMDERVEYRVCTTSPFVTRTRLPNVGVRLRLHLWDFSLRVQLFIVNTNRVYTRRPYINCYSFTVSVSTYLYASWTGITVASCVTVTSCVLRPSHA